MRTTIVIPSYNQQEFLMDSIESALSQKADVLVVDDGSTDNSLEIARSYGVRVISQVNKGLSSARNTGIMNTDTELIAFLDADDILLDDFIEKTEAKMEDDVDAVCASFREFGISNAEIQLISNPKVEDFEFGNRLPYCGLFRRSKLLEVGGYSPRMIWGYEDLHLWMDFLNRGFQIVTLPEVLWLYRTKEKSMYTESQKHHIDLMNQIRKDFPNGNLKF